MLGEEGWGMVGDIGRGWSEVSTVSREVVVVTE